MLLCFDPETFNPIAFDQNAPHTEGPELYKKLFVYTGNTQYGVQNLEFPNNPIYLVDGSVPACEKNLPVYGAAYQEGLRGEMLTLRADAGILHQASGVWGIPTMPRVADTGFISLGNEAVWLRHTHASGPRDLDVQ